MESQTSFDLNRQIQAWREKLAQSPAFRAENLEELEAHLRDSTARLQAGGLSVSDAFQLATRRIGGDGLLAAEFGKVNRREIWMTRLLWMLVGLQVWGLVNSFTTNLARATSTLVMSPFNSLGSRPSANELLHGLAIPVAIFTLAQLLALGGSLALCAWLIMGKGQYFGQWVGRFIQRNHLLVSSGVILTAMLLAKIVAETPEALLYKFYGHATLQAASMAQSYAMRAIGLVQVVTLLILTMALARKRFLETGWRGLKALYAERTLWMLVGVQLWGAVGRMERILAEIVSMFALNDLTGLSPTGGQLVPVGVVTLIHLIALAGSLGFCWWLIICQGPALGTWVKRTSGWRVSMLGAGVVLTSWAIAWFVSNLVLLRLQANDDDATLAVTQSMIFSVMLTEPCRMITLIILTIILAKKSLQPGNPATPKFTLA